MKMSFEQFMAAVDAAVYAKVGVSVYDLPDVAFRDMYEAGNSPVTAAKTAVREAGGEF
jgi:hypothetical protein